MGLSKKNFFDASINDNQSNAPNYFPNSFSGPNHNSVHLEPAIAITADAKRYDSGNDDNFSQCGIFWNNVLNEQQRQNLIDNMSSHLIDAADL
jgi:catalase